MLNHQKVWGHYGEQLASQFLKKLGYQILALNHYCHHEEIDLIAQDGQTLVLVEVKLRCSQSFGTATEALTINKLTHLKKAASYLINKYQISNWRYDFIAIDVNSIKSSARLRHYRQIL
ncbi:MAG TPA: YraN family protein [bacterium]|mgnify:CR=1 FL=1|nr:YraN family protein [bacterium]